MAGTRPKGAGLFKKVTRALLGVLLGLTVAQIGLAYWMFARVSQESEQRMMLSSAARIAELVAPHVTEYADYAELQRLGREFTAANARLELFLLTEDGTVLGRFGQGGHDIVVPRVPVEDIRTLISEGSNAALPFYGPDPSIRGRTTIFSAAPMTILGKPGYVYVTLDSLPSRNIYTMSAENLSAFVAIGGFVACGLVVALIGLSMLRYFKKRLQSLGAVVRRFSENDFSVRIPVGPSDEIDWLAGNINAMADKLEENISQLERRDILRRELIADVSHDLRGPLASIKGYVEILGRMTPQSLAERLPVVLPSLDMSTGALDRLLSELFELAKLEAKEREPQFLAMEVDTLLEDVCISCRPIAEQKGLRLSLSIAGEKLVVRADVSLLERAIRNLVDNAIYYSPAGTEVVLEASGCDEGVKVTVRDQGAGIAEHDISRIFGRFARGENSEKSSRASTGLGLAIVQRILEIHGSQITVVSTPGKGSSFSFIVPRNSAADPNSTDRHSISAENEQAPAINRMADPLIKSV